MNADEVAVWTIPLRRATEMAPAYCALLNAAEHARASRFVRAGDAARFITTRGVVRMILADYLGTKPWQIAFRYSEHGKPELCDDPALRFNVSHSRDRAVCAVTRRRSIGVDVEWVDDRLAVAPLAERFFSRIEADALRFVEEPHRTTAFYRCWTRKEAYVKATGRGLAEPLDSFAMSIDTPARLVWTARQEDAARWQVFDIAAAADYVAAVVFERTASRPAIRQFDWTHQRSVLNPGELCEHG